MSSRNVEHGSDKVPGRIINSPLCFGKGPLFNDKGPLFLWQRTFVSWQRTFAERGAVVLLRVRFVNVGAPFARLKAAPARVQETLRRVGGASPRENGAFDDESRRPIYLSTEGALSSDGLQHLRDRLEPRPCTHAHEGRLRRPGAPPVPTSFCTARRPGNLTRLSCEDRCLVRSQILSRMRRRHGRRCAIARGQVVLAIRREHIQHDRRLQRPRLMLDPASQDETVTASDLEHFGPAAET